MIAGNVQASDVQVGQNLKFSSVICVNKENLGIYLARVYDEIKHGDTAHREWLAQKFLDIFKASSAHLYGQFDYKLNLFTEDGRTSGVAVQ